MRNLMTLTVIALTAGLMSCGGGLTQEDMAKAWAATNGALTSGQTIAATAGALTNQDATLNLSYDYSCVGGGSASFTGDYDVTTDLSGNMSGGFLFDIGFDGCETSGIIIDGNLVYDVTYASTATGVNYSFTYQGSLTYSGEVNGTCDIDMVYNMNIDYGMGGAYDLSYSGTICGYDAAADLSGSANYGL